MPSAADRRKTRIEPIRWTLEQAGSEFGRDARALAKRIKRGSILPGEDGRFSTLQICQAVFGDRDAEELRKTSAEADLAELKAKERQRLLLKADDVYRFFEGYFIVIRQRILASKLSRQEQDDLLRELQGLSYDEIERAGIGRDVSEASEDSDSAAEADLPGVG